MTWLCSTDKTLQTIMEYRVHPVLFDYLFFPLLKLEDPLSSLNTLTKYLILGLKYFKEWGYEFLQGVLTLWNL